MKSVEVKGLVLRVVDVGESDRMLTLYTDKLGLVGAMAKGAKKITNKKNTGTTEYCYSTFILVERNDKYYVNDAECIELFFGLRSSIDGIALGAYIVEVLSAVGTTDPEPDLLRLSLNALYALSEGVSTAEKVKASFEIRVASILGFMPDILSCHDCDEREGDFYFDVMAGVAECRECYRKKERRHETVSEEHESHIVYILSPGARTALNYSIYSPIERIFSYNLADEDMHLFSRASEAYLLHHLERGFRTLDFYNEVKR